MTEATRIDAGRVVIDGNTSLSDWSASGPTTIAGGKLCTNTTLPGSITLSGFRISREETSLEPRLLALEAEVSRLRRIINDGRCH